MHGRHRHEDEQKEDQEYRADHGNNGPELAGRVAQDAYRGPETRPVTNGIERPVEFVEEPKVEKLDDGEHRERGPGDSGQDPPPTRRQQ